MSDNVKNIATSPARGQTSPASFATGSWSSKGWLDGEKSLSEITKRSCKTWGFIEGLQQH